MCPPLVCYLFVDESLADIIHVFQHLTMPAGPSLARVYNSSVWKRWNQVSWIWRIASWSIRERFARVNEWATREWMNEWMDEWMNEWRLAWALACKSITRYISNHLLNSNHVLTCSERLHGRGEPATRFSCWHFQSPMTTAYGHTPTANVFFRLTEYKTINEY